MTNIREDDIVWLKSSISSSSTFPQKGNSFSLVKVKSTSSNVITVEYLDGSKVEMISIDNIFPADPRQCGSNISTFADCCQLKYLNEATLLRNLKLRYDAGSIYTFNGPILLSINPYCDISEIYLPENYQYEKNKNNPHLYTVVERAMRGIKHDLKPHTIVISGESGAGKTESCRQIVKYVVEKSKSLSNSHNDGKLKAMASSTTILDAFGNAKTIRNDNSSRFGKNISISIDGKGDAVCLAISSYLLELSRVCFQEQHERNYHIFYQMCAARQELPKNLQLDEPKNFRYLYAGNCDRIDDVDEKLNFGIVQECFNSYQLGQEWEAIMSILAGILHLGQFDFKELPFDREDKCQIKNGSPIDIVCDLWGLDSELLEKTLCSRSYTQIRGRRGSLSHKTLKIHECYAARDSLAKIVYSQLFEWIISKLNERFDDIAKVQKDSVPLNLLDLPGFEFSLNGNNSLEQLTINYANEKIQQFFLKQCCDLEIAMYKAEGISIPEMSWANPYDKNGVEGVLGLIEGKQGIFSLLIEESKIPDPSNAHFNSSVNYYHQQNTSLGKVRTFFLRPDEAFVIHHYAGTVCYRSANFVEKNNSSIHPDFSKLLGAANNTLLQKLFKPISEHIDDTAQKKRTGSLVSEFKSQLNLLLASLSNCNCSFIRCFKPNDMKVPFKLNEASLLDQINASGLVQALKVISDGYPCRIPMKSLEEMYNKTNSLRVGCSFRWFCEAFLRYKGAISGSYQFGLNHLFLKSGYYSIIEEMMDINDSEKIIFLSSNIWKWFARKRWKVAHRTYSAFKEFLAIGERAKTTKITLIQSIIRGHLQRLLLAKKRADDINRRISKMTTNLRIETKSESKDSDNANLMIPPSPVVFQSYSPLMPVSTRDKKKNSCDFDVNYSTVAEKRKSHTSGKVSLSYRFTPMKSLLTFNNGKDDSNVELEVLNRLRTCKKLRDQMLEYKDDSNRYFRLPFVRSVVLHHLGNNGDKLGPRDGFLCLHFCGDDVERQMEVVPGILAILMERTLHESMMCKVTLGSLGIDQGNLSYEISEQEFQGIWSSLQSHSSLEL